MTHRFKQQKLISKYNLIPAWSLLAYWYQGRIIYIGSGFDSPYVQRLPADNQEQEDSVSKQTPLQIPLDKS